MESSPLTMNRAATAVVRSRILLEGAEEELRLALRILREGPVDPSPLDLPERLALMRRLEQHIARLQALHEMSRSIWDRGASWWVDPVDPPEERELRVEQLP